MIQSFSDPEAEKIWSGQVSKKLPQEIQNKARMKLRMLDAAVKIEDLKIPPGNRLHRLQGERGGQYSICVNMQYRICFKWNEGNAHEVEIVDYH